jgi:hypothetical protein
MYKGVCDHMSSMNFIQESLPPPAERRPAVMLLTLAERTLLGVIIATAITCFAYVTTRQQAVDWPDFRPDFAFSLSLILMGMALRKSRYLARTAMATIAFGLTLCFLICSGILTMTVLPFANPMVDQHLLAADAAFGFSWVDAVNALADYPKVGLALRYIYVSLLPQLAFVIILLSVLRRATELHRFLTVFYLSMLMSSGIWWLFPSVGPAAYGMVSEAVQQKILLVANADYGETMWRYATEGNSIITKSKMAGVIAFPSMHIVMTCMVLWFTRSTWAFVPLLVLNFAMPVATVLQGGHHVVDLFGGFAVFGLCLWAAIWLVPDKKVTDPFDLPKPVDLVTD